MKLITENESEQLICPVINSICLGHKCMAFDLIHPNITRENHSGGKQMMYEQRSKRGGQEFRLEGPDGCDGLLILDALYTCVSLYPKEAE